MPIGRKRRTELRLEALSIVWRVLDEKVKDVELDDYSAEEAQEIRRVLDSKAQEAFDKWETLNDKIKRG